MDEHNVIAYECCLMCAFRYALNRRSYVVKTVANFIISELPKLSDRTILLMQKELQGDVSGDSYDILEWRKLYAALNEQIINRKLTGN